MVAACGETQFESLRNGGSYLSRNDPRAHFGLGVCGETPRVTLQWPDGKKQVVNRVPINRYVSIAEP